jgi:hypothetical protein
VGRCGLKIKLCRGPAIPAGAPGVFLTPHVHGPQGEGSRGGFHPGAGHGQAPIEGIAEIEPIGALGGTIEDHDLALLKHYFRLIVLGEVLPEWVFVFEAEPIAKGK